jgi:hypothetical protein
MLCAILRFHTTHEEGSMDLTEFVDEKRSEANRLYWEDSRSVEELTTALGMSRAALYASVVPRPARVACDACGGECVYPNRSHRASGRVRCDACGVVAAASAEPAHAGEGSEAGDAENGSEGRVDRWRRDLDAVDGSRKRLIGGGAALGVLAGVAAVAAARGLR